MCPRVARRGPVRPEPPDPRSPHAALAPVAVMTLRAPSSGVPRTVTLDTRLVRSFTGELARHSEPNGGSGTLAGRCSEPNGGFVDRLDVEGSGSPWRGGRSEEHTSELQSPM